MDEDEFEYDGKIYVSKQAAWISGCRYCSFSGVRCKDIPSCHKEVRRDNRNVIFVEKQK